MIEIVISSLTTPIMASFKAVKELEPGESETHLHRRERAGVPGLLVEALRSGHRQRRTFHGCAIQERITAIELR
jgi:hypothetical protein